LVPEHILMLDIQLEQYTNEYLSSIREKQNENYIKNRHYSQRHLRRICL
jgi:hypothetical protein